MEKTSTGRWDFEQGEEIAPGRFALERLGRGTRYETWLALDERLMSVVVCKLLRPDRVDDEHARREIAREAEILFTLAHPIVVRALDAELDGPRPHIVLEHLEGPTLRRLLRRYGTLEMEQLLPLTLHVCAALNYLALCGVVHLDVKPENIIMSAPPRLIDLSIARTIQETSSITEPLGTYAYMAPEQAAPGTRGDIGSAADVWALGVTLFEAINGTRPFETEPGTEDAPPELLQLYDEPLPLRKGVPSELVEIVMACLRDDPLSRPSAADVALAIEPLVARSPRYPILRLRRPIRA
jgi:serine/threonine protein kinase